MKSWKTTAAAVATALGTLLMLLPALLDGDPATVVDFSMLMQAGVGLAVAFGFWKARDDDVSSEGLMAAKDVQK